MSDSWAQEGREKKAKELANLKYEEAGLGQPSPKKKKRFVIEYRMKDEYWLSPSNAWLTKVNRENKWRNWRAYKKERQRDEAFDTITTRKDYWGKYYEFRKVELC